MRFLPRTLGTLALTGLAAASAFTWLACDTADNTPDYGPPGQCSVNCGVSSGGGIQGTHDGGTTTGTGGSTVTVGELTGTIEPFSDATFLTVTQSALSGSAQIVLQPQSTGSAITIPYGGGSTGTFDQMNVPSGNYWVTVQDESAGANGIWNTITGLAMPQVGAVNLPVVLKSTFTSLASTLPAVQSQGVNAQSAQVVLLLTYNSAPFSGAQVTSGQNGGVVAYDQGFGNYSDTATTTGSAGTIILFNAGSGASLTIGIASAALGRTWTVQVYTAPGAVTVAGFSLQ